MIALVYYTIAVSYEWSKLILSSTVFISLEWLLQQNGLATSERSHLASAYRQLFFFPAVVNHKKSITFSGYLVFTNKMANHRLANVKNYIKDLRRAA